MGAEPTPGWKWEQTIAKLWVETRQFCALLVSHFILLQTLHQKSLMQHLLLRKTVDLEEEPCKLDLPLRKSLSGLWNWSPEPQLSETETRELCKSQEKILQHRTSPSKGKGQS